MPRNSSGPLFILSLILAGVALNSSLSHAQVNVSPSGNSGNTIAQANTSDNVAVGPDGTIYVAYHGSNGVRVARSTDNGQSFGAPITVTASDFEAEIAVSSNGTVYVAWVDDTAGNSLMLAKSTDEAQSFASPVDTGFSFSTGVASSTPTAHFSADGDHLYFVGQTGQKVIVSSDGGSTFEKRSISQPSDRVFSDVLVDPTTRDVIAQFDDPSVTYAVSTDLGASFGNPKTPNPQPSVSFSVGAISTSDQGRFLLIAGDGGSLERVDLDTNDGTSTSIPSSASQGRSLAADGFGNVVTGYVESGNVKFKVSTDAGNNFGTATTVASASAAQADINRTNGDVMFIYEDSGNILMRTFSDQLDGYGLTVSRSTIDFGDVPKGTSSGTESVTVTNETGGDVAVNSISTTSPFSVSNDNCPSTLGDTESCTVDVIFSPSSTGSFAEDLEIATDQPNSPRTVSLLGAGVVGLNITGTDGYAPVGGEGADAGWRFLGLPEQITRQALNDNFNYDFDNLASGHAAYVWDGTTGGNGGQQWTALTSDSDNIDEGEGVALFFFDDADDPIESATGPNGPFTMTFPSIAGPDETDVSLSGLGQGQFLFLGNPYQSAYDLSSLDITSSDFSQTVQVYDPGQGTFVTKDRSNSETVAAIQGFVVERLSPGGGPTSLTFSSGGIQGGTGSFIGSKQASSGSSGEQAPVELSLTVESAEGDTLSRDRATVRFDTRAGPEWDAYEATQLTPPQAGSYATLSSPVQRLLQGDSTVVRRTLAAEPFPEAGQAATVPLSARSVDLSGTATIALQNAPDAAGPLELVDTQTDQTIDLREQEYTFGLAAGDGEVSDPSEARFQLKATTSALPVELAGFTAERDRQSVRLTWRTASETGNAGFAVQHRREMQGEAPQGEAAWTQLGFVEGSGTTDAPQRYQFRTSDLSVGTHRFRLKQVDTDGSTSLSEVVTVEMGLQEAYRLTPPAPNPTTSGARLQLTVRETQPVRVAVYDVLGREVSVLRQGPLSGQAPTTLRAGRDLPAGTYFVRATGETFTATRRLTIVR